MEGGMTLRHTHLPCPPICIKAGLVRSRSDTFFVRRLKAAECPVQLIVCSIKHVKHVQMVFHQLLTIENFTFN